MFEDPLHSKSRTKKYLQNFKIYKSKSRSFLAIGDVGKGKSVTCATITEILWYQYCKIVDLYSAGRFEGAYRALPSLHPYWKHKRRINNKIFGARSFPVKLLYPMGNKLPKKLPDISEVFTIPVNSLDHDDLKALVGEDITPSVKTLWESLVDQMDDKISAIDVDREMKRLVNKKVPSKKINFGVAPTGYGLSQLSGNVFRPLMREKLLSSKRNFMSLDLVKELNDRKVITVLVLKHTPKFLHNFIVNYFINHMFKLKRDGLVKPTIYVQLREAADVLRNDLTNASEVAIKNNISRILRQQRTGMYFVFDTQHPGELPLVKDQFDTVIVHRTGAVGAALELAGYTEKSGYLDRDDRDYIPLLRTGECYIFQKNESNKVIREKIRLPQHMIWQGSQSDFYTDWGKYSDRKNKWIMTENLTKFITEEIDKSLDYWNKREVEEKLNIKERHAKMQEKRMNFEFDKKREELKKKIKLDIEIKKFRDIEMQKYIKEKRIKKKLKKTDSIVEVKKIEVKKEEKKPQQNEADDFLDKALERELSQ